jgi:hypothetical protein
MATSAPRPWTVFHPQPLVQRAPNLWTVEDQVPGLAGATRTMTVVRRDDGTLLFFNAIPVPDATLTAIQALGRPTALVVPNALHSLDAGAFTARLALTAYAPALALEALAPRVACRPISELPAGPDVRVFTVEGFKTKEIVLLVRDTLVIADLVTNAPHGHGFNGFMMRLVGFTGPAPRLPWPVRKRVQTDAVAVRALLTQLASLPGVTRLIPSHGPVVEQGVAAALEVVAASF